MNFKAFINFSSTISKPKRKISLKSNLQKSILEFYREVLKFCYKKPEVFNIKLKIFEFLFYSQPNKTTMLNFVNSEFRKNMIIPKNKFNTV